MTRILTFILVLGSVFTYVNCQRPPGKPCSTNPCNNGGSCQEQPANNVGYICRCVHPWMGYNCQFLNNNNVGAVATDTRMGPPPPQYPNMNGQYPNAHNPNVHNPNVHNPNDPNRLKKQNYYAGNNWPNNNNALFPNAVVGWQDQQNMQNPQNGANNQWQPNLPNQVNPANNPWAYPNNYNGNNGYNGNGYNKNGYNKNGYGYWQNSGQKLACCFSSIVFLMLSVVVQILLN